MLFNQVEIIYFSLAGIGATVAVTATTVTLIKERKKKLRDILIINEKDLSSLNQ